jgi:hypothetical protein
MFSGSNSRTLARGLTIGVATGAAGFGLAGVAAAGGLHAHTNVQVVRGTVVHENPHARSFVVADARGELYAIHAARRPALASTVTVAIRPLRNGTYALAGLRSDASRRSAQVRLHGVVTFVDRRTDSFVLSAPGVSMLVHRGARRAGVASAADAVPSVGSVDTVSASVDDQGPVAATGVTQTAQATTVTLEGIVLGIDATTNSITISATDDSASSGSITVAVPSTLSISLFSLGQEVELTATTGAGGTYTLVGSSGDQSQQAAEDQTDQQGVQGDNSGGQDGVQSGDSQGSGDDGQSTSQTSTEQLTTSAATTVSTATSAGTGDN